jgi:hypothetical protein
MEERLHPRSSRIGMAMTLVDQNTPAVMKLMRNATATITHP